MGTKQVDNLQDVSSVTEPTPLIGSALENFYVQTDTARDPHFPTANWLHDYIYRDTSSLKLLFASHPGAGKTTEINFLMDRARDDFLVVYFSVRDELDIATLTSVDLILALMEKLYRLGMKNGLIKDARVIEPVRNWLGDFVPKSFGNDEKNEFVANTNPQVSILLNQVVAILAKMKESFLYSYESATTFRQAIRPRLAELRNYCNLVITEIKHNLAKITPSRQLLIIVDDTDKLDLNVARELFIKQTAILSNIQASIIYTVPLYLIHSPDLHRLESYFDTLTLPMIKTCTIEGMPFDEGREILKNIVLRRLASHLIDEEALDLAIEKTGGILRDLLRVIQHASEYARFAKDEKITVEAVRSSLDRLKTTYSTSVYGRDGISTDDLYTKLREVKKAPNGRVPVDERLQLLLYTQAVIQYNGRGWYDLHPLMWEILQEMGMDT